MIDFVWRVSLIGWFAFATTSAVCAPAKKIVLIAGRKSHGPGEHEYLQSLRLLKVLLDRAPNLQGLTTELYADGWPDDAKTLDSADTIVFFSDGMEQSPVFSLDDRVETLEKQIDRGCGFVAIHYTTYIPSKYGSQALAWGGGFVDYDGDPAQRSRLKTTEADMELASPEHPVSRGVTPFHMRDEFYYKIHFEANDARFSAILRASGLSGDPAERTVAWAVERQDGGRGFETTSGHYYENWRNENYRRLLLNAIIWSAGMAVPAQGVQSEFADEEEVQTVLMKNSPAQVADLSLMPWPEHVERRDGAVALGRCLQFIVSGGDTRVGHRVAHLQQQLSLRTGVRFTAEPQGAEICPVFAVRTGSSGLGTQTVGEDESYRVVADDGRIELTAPTPLGIIHGVETLLQLLQQGPKGWVIPAVVIDDHPRFAWRGLMLDVTRHFMPVDVLRRNLDGMAAVKLNTLHLHLSDDEGFRVETKSFPRLQGLASGGQFYTQDQVRDLIAYARDRGIRIVPEFDVPGHSMDWIVAAPELSSMPGQFGLVRGMEDTVRPPLDPTLDATYRVLDTVFGEMAGLFPDEYFHIGGDEIDSKYWDNNPQIQAWMREHNLADAHALHGYFNRRLQAIVAKYGKRMEGWDEILDPKLPKDTLVQSWRGQKSLADAAHMGYRSILSAGWYLDLMYPASQYYAVDPFSGETASLTAAEKELILGGEAAQWVEYVTPESLDNRLWPRLGAIAERLWSPASVTDVHSMYRRLDVLSKNLEWLDLRHRTNSARMLQRLAGEAPVAPLATLAEAVEPVKEYDREKTNPYNVYVPLNRLVDTIPPESDVAREFSALAQRVTGDPAARAELRKRLLRWRDNDAVLQPLLTRSALLRELIPVSKQVAALSTAGLQALDAIEGHNSASPQMHSEQLAALASATAPHAELLLVIAPAVRHLIETEPTK